MAMDPGTSGPDPRGTHRLHAISGPGHSIGRLSQSRGDGQSFDAFIGRVLTINRSEVPASVVLRLLSH